MLSINLHVLDFLNRFRFESLDYEFCLQVLNILNNSRFESLDFEFVYKY